MYIISKEVTHINTEQTHLRLTSVMRLHPNLVYYVYSILTENQKNESHSENRAHYKWSVSLAH